MLSCSSDDRICDIKGKTRSPARKKRVCLMTSAHPAYDTRVFQKEARTLSSAGYEVHLIAPHSREEVTYGIHIIPVTQGAGRLSRIFVAQRMLLIALRLRADVYHIHDPELLPVAWLLKIIKGVPVIYDCHEYYADSVLTREWVPKIMRSFTSLVTEKVEKTIAGKLTAVVTVNEDMRRRFTYRGVHTIAVHNYPILSRVECPVEAETEPSAVLLYLGLMDKSRGLEIVTAALSLLREQGIMLRCYLVGKVDTSGVSSRSLALMDQYKRKGYLHLTGQIPYEDVEAFIRLATVCWIPWQPTPNNIKGLPTKLFEYMACGKPVVASNFGYIGQVVASAGCGMLVSADDPSEHAAAIVELMRDDVLRQKYARNGRAAVEARYSWQSQGNALIDLYERIVGPGKR